VGATAKLNAKKLFDFGLRRRDAYRRVFTTPEGEAVLADLMDQCGWNKDLFHEDPLTTANLCGRRWVVLHIHQILKITNQDLDRVMDQHRRQLEE